MEEYDVIIIGAGPAGLKAAEVLAKHKKKVLVLEKNKIIGPKVCAAGITSKDMQYMPEELVTMRRYSFIMQSPTKRARIHSDNHEVACIERAKLGEYMLTQAQKAGAEVKTESLVTKINPKSVICNGKEYSYHYLIGADGSNSLVRRSLGLKTGIACVSAQYILPIKLKDFEIHYNTKKYDCWYAWIFPHNDYTSIGIGVLLKSKKSKHLRHMLDEFCKEKNINTKNAKFEASLINADYQGFEFGSKFLVGDAAGLANPFTGEGIYPAIVSGEDVAKKILNPRYSCPKLQTIIHRNNKLKKILLTLYNVRPLLHITYWLGFKLIDNKKLQRKLIKKFLEY